MARSPPCSKNTEQKVEKHDMNDFKFALHQRLKYPDIIIPAALGFAFALAANLAWGAPATDWPRFRGPNGSGISDARYLPVEFGPNTNLAWKSSVPAGISSPVIANG